MFDAWRGKPYKPHVVHSPDRYAAQFPLLEALDADIIALNEVTPTWIDQLRGAPHLRDYQLIDGVPRSGFGNAILSRLPVEDVRHITLPRLRRPVLQVRLLAPIPSVVCAAHLSAGSNNTERRAVQLAALNEALRDAKPTLVVGDLNLHSGDEDRAIPDGFCDAWSQLRPADPGYTFDATRNAMMAHMWPLGFEHRQMRLDRVLVRGALAPKDIHLFADRPIYPETPETVRVYRGGWRAPPALLARRAVEQIGDLVGVNLLRDPRRYLYPSDHFGLVCTLAP